MEESLPTHSQGDVPIGRSEDFSAHPEPPFGRDESILILAPTGEDARLSADFLEKAGLSTKLCQDTTQLPNEIALGCGAILVAEEALGTSTVAALSEAIARQPSWSDVLIVIITSGTEVNRPARLRRLAAFGPTGNVTFLERPFHPETLISTCQVALRSRRRQYQVRDLLREREEAKAELEAVVVARTAQLQANVASLESLLYSIAHDLRSPLRAMQGFATALEQDYRSVLDDTGREFTRRISLAANRMDAFTVDLLSFGRVVNTELSLVRTNTQETLAKALEELQDEIANGRGRVEVLSPLAEVWANPTLLQQIMANLVGNAFKYVAPGTVPHVRVWTQVQDSTVRLCVQDNGIGIDPRYHTKIFSVFERLHGAAEYSGTGIGLAIVQKGIEKMGGRVGVESQLGQGSCFWVELRVPQ